MDDTALKMLPYLTPEGRAELLGGSTERRFRPISSKQLDEKRFKREWLIKDVLVKGKAGVVGGQKKVFKTTKLVDAAISMGTGAPFLGYFPVPKVAKVVMFTGESGEDTIQETAWRVAQARGVKLAGAQVHWCFNLPQLASELDLAEMHDLIAEERYEVAIIDPLYPTFRTSRLRFLRISPRSHRPLWLR